MTADPAELIAHHEEVNGKLADIAKAARDALAIAEIDLANAINEVSRITQLWQTERATVLTLESAIAAALRVLESGGTTSIDRATRLLREALT